LRAKALGTNPSFIAELANLVDTVLRGADPILAARTGGCVVQCPACPRGYVGGCQA
jgi:protoporphyrin/coproporphyrin ferrochelatase